jgi:hypothetical protein
VWISFVVPVAVLLGTLLLQRLETRLLGDPVRDERPAGREAVPVGAERPLVSRRGRPRRAPRSPVLRATA